MALIKKDSGVPPTFKLASSKNSCQEMMALIGENPDPPNFEEIPSAKDATPVPLKSDYEEMLAFIGKNYGDLRMNPQLRMRIREKLEKTRTTTRGGEDSYTPAELRKFCGYYAISKQGSRQLLAINLLFQIQVLRSKYSKRMQTYVQDYVITLVDQFYHFHECTVSDRKITLSKRFSPNFRGYS